MNEPLFHYPNTKSDKEQFDFMLKISHDARECYDAYKRDDQKRVCLKVIELVKTGYTREELGAFLNVLFEVEQ